MLPPRFEPRQATFKRKRGLVPNGVGAQERNAASRYSRLDAVGRCLCCLEVKFDRCARPQGMRAFNEHPAGRHVDDEDVVAGTNPGCDNPMIDREPAPESPALGSTLRRQDCHC